jgi:2-polyprenyl-3-methyl-5-hydroxy-6-metoxy-1,4-benzoquinol methylase
MAQFLSQRPHALYVSPSFPDLLKLETTMDAVKDFDFTREDESDDSGFYSKPFFVHHIQSGARASITAYLRNHVLVRPGMRVLDLCASWDSHLPPEIPVHVVGVGLQQQELAANKRLCHHYHVCDLNRDASLRCLDDQLFDVLICTVSIGYLTNPVRVLQSLHSRISSDVVIFISDRYFKAKVNNTKDQSCLLILKQCYKLYR